MYVCTIKDLGKLWELCFNADSYIHVLVVIDAGIYGSELNLRTPFNSQNFWPQPFDHKLSQLSNFEASVLEVVTIEMLCRIWLLPADVEALLHDIATRKLLVKKK